MWIGRLLNKALACVLRSCFTKKLKLCRSIPSSSLWSESCKACSQWLLCMPLSVCLSLTALETHSNSLFIFAFPGSLNIYTTFAHLLLVYPFPNKVTIFRMTAKQRFAIFRFHLNTCQFCSSLWQFGITMAVRIWDSSLYPIQDRKRLYIIAVLTSGIG